MRMRSKVRIAGVYMVDGRDRLEDLFREGGGDNPSRKIAVAILWLVELGRSERQVSLLGIAKFLEDGHGQVVV